MNKTFQLCAVLATTVAFGCDRQASVADATATPKSTPVAERPVAAVPAPEVLLVNNDPVPDEVPAAPAPNVPQTPADKAWTELLKVMEPPSTPEEWETTRPTPEALIAFQRTNATQFALAADKARQFYTKYSDHAKAEEAREREFYVLNLAVQLGNTNVLARLETVEGERLKNPKLSEEDRFELRVQQVGRLLSSGRETATGATLDKMEASVRALRKEFTNRTEVAALLLIPAEGRLDNNEPEKARALATEAADLSGDPEVQAEAQSLMKKINRIGKPVEMKFKAVDGRDVDLQKMKGKVVLVDFWATWCGPCMAELPKVKAAYEKLHAKGFEIVGISFDQDKAALERVLKREKMAWPQHFNENPDKDGFGEQFEIASIPTMWLIDKKGNLRDLNAREKLSEKVEKLLAE